MNLKQNISSNYCNTISSNNLQGNEENPSLCTVQYIVQTESRGHLFGSRFIKIHAFLFQNDREHRPVQPWALICDILLSRNLKAGTVFQLRQGTDISLLCEVHPLPHFSISEEVIDHRTNRFLLRQNSETPV